MIIESFDRALASLGIKIEHVLTFRRFEAYFNALVAKNEVMNLTSITDEQGVYLRHFADSAAALLALPHLNREQNGTLSIIDVGCGAGFPGLPLKILCDDKGEESTKLVLLDSTTKKIEFLKGLCAELQLSNVSFISDRAEIAARKPQYREGFDLALSRAVADMRILAELCLPFVRRDGIFAAHKSARSETEISLSNHAFEVLGGQLFDVLPYQFEDMPPMGLALIKKVRPTHKTYPRAFPRIKKRPL